MNLRKVFVIARREFWTNFKRRSFLFTAFGVPLITFVALYVVFSLVQQAVDDTTGFKTIGIVDQASVIKPDLLTSPYRLAESEDAAAADLKSGGLDAYFLLPPDFLKTGKISVFNRQGTTLSEAISDQFSGMVVQHLSAQFSDPNLAARLANPLKNVKIFRVGSTQELDQAALFGTFLVPFIFTMLVFTGGMATSQFLLSGLVEEKENRMMELFATSARPTEMLWGKLLGLGALGLSQIGIWAAFALIIGTLQGNVNVERLLATYQITPGFLALLLVFFILGYFVFGTLMSAFGVMVNAEQEGRQISSIISIVAIAPYFFIMQYLQSPNEGIAQFLSLFPLTSPVGMILRLSWANVPPGEIALSIVILVATVIALIWFAARMLRLGMLNYGKKLSLRDIFRALVEGRQVITSREKKEAEVGV